MPQNTTPHITAPQHQAALDTIVEFCDSLPEHRQSEFTELVKRAAAARRAGLPWHDEAEQGIASLVAATIPQ